jgi:hypothetical protein
MAVASTLAHYDTAIITAVKSVPSLHRLVGLYMDKLNVFLSYKIFSLKRLKCNPYTISPIGQHVLDTYAGKQLT